MWNISADYLTDVELYNLKQSIVRSNSRFNLVFGRPSFAMEIKDAAPDKEVCYREYFPDPDGDGDNSVHLRVTDGRELARYHLARIPARYNILAHGGNEPALTPELIAWSMDYADEILKAGGRAILLNLSVGNPEPEQWAIADPLLRLVAKHRNQLWIGLHAYSVPLLPYEFVGKDGTQPHQWPAKVNGSSWLMPRYRDLLTYCDKHNIARPNIAFTELGWDYIHAAAAYQDTLPASGGCEKTGGMWCNQTVWGEWLRNTGMDWQEYAYKQVQWAWDAIYRHDPEVKGFAFFCYGHVEDWIRYDAKAAPDFVKRMEQGNWSMSTQPPPNPAQWMKSVTWNTAMNLRPVASTGVQAIVVIPPDTAVTVINPKVAVNTYAWVNVRYGTKEGWVALGKVEP